MYYTHTILCVMRMYTTESPSILFYFFFFICNLEVFVIYSCITNSHTHCQPHVSFLLTILLSVYVSNPSINIYMCVHTYIFFPFIFIFFLLLYPLTSLVVLFLFTKGACESSLVNIYIHIYIYLPDVAP